MPMHFPRNQIRLEGACGVEDALPLLERLSRGRQPKVDLRACTHLHTALVQVLAACPPARLIPPEDPFLAQWLMPLLRSQSYPD